jgi:hypothetical protein
LFSPLLTDYGLPPDKASWAVHAMVAHHYFAGAAYPTGGAAELARRIIPTIEAAAGLGRIVASCYCPSTS